MQRKEIYNENKTTKKKPAWSSFVTSHPTSLSLFPSFFSSRFYFSHADFKQLEFPPDLRSSICEDHHRQIKTFTLSAANFHQPNLLCLWSLHNSSCCIPCRHFRSRYICEQPTLYLLYSLVNLCQILYINFSYLPYTWQSSSARTSSESSLLQSTLHSIILLLRWWWWRSFWCWKADDSIP